MERCPNCGASIRTGARFCTACGNRIMQPVAAPDADVAVPILPVAGAPVRPTASADAQQDQPAFESVISPAAMAPANPTGTAESDAPAGVSDAWGSAMEGSDGPASEYDSASAPTSPVLVADASGPTERDDAASASPERAGSGWSTWSSTRDDPSAVSSPTADRGAPADAGEDAPSADVAADISAPPYGDVDRIDEVVESRSSTISAVGTDDASVDPSVDRSGVATDAPQGRDDDGSDVIALPAPDAVTGRLGTAAQAPVGMVQTLADDVSDHLRAGFSPADSGTMDGEVNLSGAIWDESEDEAQDESDTRVPNDPVLEDVVVEEAMIPSGAGWETPGTGTPPSPTGPTGWAAADQTHQPVMDGAVEPGAVLTDTGVDYAAGSVPVGEARDEVAVDATDPDGKGAGADDDWEPWGHADQPGPTAGSSGASSVDVEPSRVSTVDGDSGGAASDWFAGLRSDDRPDDGVAASTTFDAARPADDPLGQIRHLVDALRVAVDAAIVAPSGHGESSGADAGELLQLLDGLPLDPVDLREVEALRDEAEDLEGRDFDIRALQQFALRRTLIGELVTAYLQQRDLLGQLRAAVAPPDPSSTSN